MKKNKKVLILIVICFILFLMIPFTYCKYNETVTKSINLSVRSPLYNVVFHSNDGNDNTVIQNFEYGISQTLTLNTFTSDTGEFTGWNTDPLGNGTSYSDGQEVNNLSSIDASTIDLYAQWIETGIHTINYVGIVPDSTLPRRVEDKQNITIDLSNYKAVISEITMGGVKINNYTYRNSIITLSNVTGNVVINLVDVSDRDFVIDGTETTLVSSQISPTTPVNIADFLNMTFGGIISTDNIIIKSIDVNTRYTSTTGSNQSVNCTLKVNGANFATNKISFSGKQTNQLATTTFSGLNIGLKDEFLISYDQDKLTNQNIDVTLESIVIHF